MALANHLASKALSGLRASKAEGEEGVMRGFLRRLALDRYALVMRERPDFLLSIPARGHPVQLACEVTDFYSDQTEHGSTDRRFFKLWLEFAESLRSRLGSEGLDHFYGAIHFNDPIRTAIPEPARFIDEIVAVLPPRHGNIIDHFDPEATPLLAAHVDHLFVRDTSPEIGILWWCAHLQTGPVPISEAALRATVTAKDQAALSYAWPQCREKWLLIHAGSRGLADKVVWDGPLIPPITAAAFDRVFLWDRFSESICQLHPSFAVVAACPTVFRSRLPEFLREAIGSPALISGQQSP